MKTFFQKNWIHFVAVAVMYITTLLYCKPVTEGYGLKQHDIQQWHGMAHEAVEYRKLFNEETLWTNSMFGGMPMMQISMIYSGNLMSKISHYYTMALGRPVDIIFMHMLGFYIFAMLLGMRPLVGLIGGVAMAFASYEIIVIQAGHNAKAMATAFMAPVLGAFIKAYRDKLSLFVLALAGIFMAFEIACNHVQVTYYLAFLLIGLGVYFFEKAIRKKTIQDFMVKTAGLVLVFVLAAIVNSGNLLLTNDYAKHTIRGGNDITINSDGIKASNQSAGLDRDYITHWSYGIGETFTLISPNVKGGGSFPIGFSQFDDALLKVVNDTPVSSAEKQKLLEELSGYGAYWGDQPFTSGPVYIGIVVFILALSSLFFWKSNMKWVFLGVSLLAIALSWGKNFMGLTNFFIDYVPGYSMFRTVTIILILVELCAVALAMFFIEYLISNREEITAKKKRFAIMLGGIVLFSLIMRTIGTSVDDFSGVEEQKQLAGVEQEYRKQILSMDPEVLKANYGLDIANSRQVKQFVDMQVRQVDEKMGKIREVRQEIYKSSWTRTTVLAFFTGLILFLYVSTSMTPLIMTLSLLALTAVDLIPVAHDYLGNQKDLRSRLGARDNYKYVMFDGMFGRAIPIDDIEGHYKYWEEEGLIKYPVATNEADREIMEMELAANPSLAEKIMQAERKGQEEAMEYGYSGQARNNVIDAKKFSVLNFNTSYRVFDQTGGFSNSRSSYFHKAIGGYHGAKLRNFQNIVDFHIAYGNNAVLDMLNTKYFIQQDAQGVVARVNPNSAGNAWTVKKVRTFDTPNDEIRALGTIFTLRNDGAGILLVNGKEKKQTIVYGTEKLQYLLEGVRDTLSVPLSNGLREKMEIVFVMDANGRTDLVMPSVFETEEGRNSFLKLVSIGVKETFDLKEEVVMLKSEASKLSSKSYTGEGTVIMTDYLPNRMEYKADLKDKQLVVFSEIYYEDGWKLFVDGKETPILKVNYLLRGAEIPAGEHKLEMIFDVPKFHTLNTIALIGSLLLFALLGAGVLIDRKKKGKNDPIV